jgi:hypothetical protein
MEAALKGEAPIPSDVVKVFRRCGENVPRHLEDHRLFMQFRAEAMTDPANEGRDV